MESLDVWNPNLSQDQKDMILKNNFAKINTAMQFLGFEILASVDWRSTQVITTSTAPLTSASRTFVSNGGLVLIIGSISFTTTATSSGSELDISFTIDGLEVYAKGIGMTPPTGSTPQEVPFYYASALPAGTHVIAINATKVGSAGVLTAGSNSFDSGYIVIEFRKG